MPNEASPGYLAAFGVGCFHFQALVNVGVGEGADNYFSLLKDFLNRDNLVRDVEVINAEYEGYIGDIDEENVAEGNDLTDLIYAYPHLQTASIKFTITIPKRLQKEYLGDFRDALKSENFEVHVVYGELAPVAFVKPEYFEQDPSTAVIILWKHMKKNWVSEGSIKFFMLGPSPFHANFFVLKSKDDYIHIDYQDEFGYDKVTISLPTSLEEHDLFEVIKYRCKDEMSVYYHAVRKKNKINRDFYDLSNEIEASLAEEIRRNGKRFRFPRGLDTYMSLIRLEKIDAEMQSLGNEIRQHLGYITQKFGDMFLENKIRSELDELKELPINTYKNIISTLKERSSTSSANKTAIISALAGVALGFFLQQGAEMLSNKDVFATHTVRAEK